MITKDSNLGEVARTSPSAARIMLDYGLHCVGCHFNAFDTVEMGAKIHGLTPVEVTEMVDRINESVTQKA